MADPRKQKLHQRADTEVEREYCPDGLVQFIRLVFRRMQRVDVVVETWMAMSHLLASVKGD